MPPETVSSPKRPQVGLDARGRDRGHRAGQWGQGDYPQACLALTSFWETPGDVARRWAEPRAGLSIALSCSPARQPLGRRAPFLTPGRAGDTRRGLGKGCSLRAPDAPSLFSSCSVPTLLYPQSVCGKNAVSSERGPRVTGGGSPSRMAPGVRDPLLRPRLPCPRPCLRLCPPSPVPYNCPRTASGQPLQVRRPSSCPSRLQVPFSPQSAGPGSSGPHRRRNLTA